MGKLSIRLRPDKYAKYRYVAILCIVLISLFFRAVSYPEKSWTWQFSLVFIQLIALTIIWEGIRRIHNYLNIVLPFERKLVLRLVVQISINFIFSGMLSLFVINLMKNYAPWQLNNPIRGLFALTSLMFLLLINFSYIATYFFEEWKKSLVVTEKLEKEKATVQYDNLKNQLNPHFLFNSITSLHSLIYENQDLAAQFLQQLSKVYRYVLQNRDNENVPLETELKFIDNYLSLLKTRFGDVFDFEISISENARDKRIVPVTLQVLIENAVKHNMMTMDKPLIIKIYDDEDYIVVENPLQIKEQVESSNKLGLLNLSNLYSFLSNKPILVEEIENVYRIKIPLL